MTLYCFGELYHFWTSYHLGTPHRFGTPYLFGTPCHFGTLMLWSILPFWGVAVSCTLSNYLEWSPVCRQLQLTNILARSVDDRGRWSHGLFWKPISEQQS